MLQEHSIIRIYTQKDLVSPEFLVLSNDAYFNIKTINDTLTNTDVVAMSRIDNAILIDDAHIQTPYGIGLLHNLSSGCKTILNILHNPQKIFSIDECGPNILDFIFSLRGLDIKIFSSYVNEFNIPDDVEIIFNNKDIVTGYKGYKRWWTAEYEKRKI